MSKRALLLLGLVGCFLAVSFAAVPSRNNEYVDDTDEMARIRAMLFQNVTKGISQPQLCFLVGGIGSGKSTALRNYVAQLGLVPAVDRVHLGFTRILVHLDGWDASDRCTSSGLRDHSKELQEMFFEEAIRSRTNVLFEGPIYDSDLVSSMVDFALARNYVVNVVAASLDARTAASRAIQQMRVNSHWVSLHELIESHKGIARAFPALLKPDEINCTLLFDTLVPGHPALVVKDNNILMPQKFADFMSEATLKEDEVRSALSDDEADTFHSLCDCRNVHDVDEVMCGSKHDKTKDYEKSRKRWRAAAIAFIILSALLLLGLIVISLRYNQLRRHGLMDEHPHYPYDPVVPPRRSPPADLGYAKIEQNA